MWPAVALTALTLALVAWRTPATWGAAFGILPIALAWLASPAIAHALGRPAVPREQRLGSDARRQAHRYALLHWRFFDRFVGAETQWLAPDNFQEEPAPVVALRTSPTNIGLQLLSTMSAYDLGFIPLEEMVLRLERALRSLERMRRFRGHFYNWYDLRDLSVLEPAYVSTVDSGNLAGHLIALRQGCLALAADPAPSVAPDRGLEAALALAEERLQEPGDAVARTEVRAARASLAAAREDAKPALERARSGLRPDHPAMEWMDWSIRALARDAPRPGATAEMLPRLRIIADRAYAYAMEMDFRFLIDPQRKLFAIGFQQATHSLDGSFYDLLASEARLASFIAIAKNEAPLEHWFQLGRTLTSASGQRALVSWSGSMFEYLMPLLVMRTYPSTLLAQTYSGAVARHRAHGAERRVPWGISESAYNVRDRHDTYQYRAFGVPDLALKRGLGRDLVVAPYASVLATLVDPQPALANLGRLERLGALGPYGFRDALDYTRPDPDRKLAVVHTYMAHHLGMGLVALTNLLCAGVWQRRFHSDALVRSVELLLHERVPRRLVLRPAQDAHPDEALPEPDLEQPAVRRLDAVDTPVPHVALLGHQPYTIMVSHCGSGYSRYGTLAVTRWRADACRDSTGQFQYLRDVANGRVWSAAHQPVCAPADRYHAELATDRVTFERLDGVIETSTEIAIVPEDSAEVRRVTLTNNDDVEREVEVTSYGEIVLAPPETDRAHPAFGNLFVETEYHDWCSAITASRRPRSATEQRLWAVHVVSTGRERVGDVSCETDRARFLGRGRSVRDPVALESSGPLSGTTGAVLDPIFALRARVRLGPGQSAAVAFTTLVTDSRERAFELADRYGDPHAAQRAMDLAWTSSQVELRELNISPSDAAVFQELAGYLFYGNPALRAPQSELRRNRGSQPQLWSQGISGDWPIVLATIDGEDGLPTLRQLLVAHRYWRRHGMTVDLVVLNSNPHGYQQELADRITAAVVALGEASLFDRPGGVFVRRRDGLSPNELLMLRATARVHLPCDGRPLGRALATALTVEEWEEPDGDQPASPRAPERSRSRVVRAVLRIGAKIPDLLLSAASDDSGIHPRPSRESAAAFGNGFGDLTENGDYRIRVQGGHVPPAPWANVVANRHGGFLVTERGGGFTWAENSYFYRLTPWHNDPVSDEVSEVIYLQDAATGELWSATSGPVRTDIAYTVRHGAGLSSFEHRHGGIRAELTLGMAEDAPVKLALLRLTNTGEASRSLRLTTYVEWNLGVLREHTQHQVHTMYAKESGAYLARNTFDPQFASWTAFHGISEPVTSHTGSRREFLGRNGTPAKPVALQAMAPLSGATGAGLDPCAALQCALELKPGASREIAIVLGAEPDEPAAHRALEEYRDVERARAALGAAAATWAARLGAVTVRTPDPAFDAMLNRWTLYQALACRMWGRSGLYQSSGAYGFRDQLQDVMAFVYAEPAVAREHILRAAARQFVEGDVQHWWHPQSGRGVRTRFSDDMAWLPYVVDHYVRVTGDASLLDEEAPFLSMRPLGPGEHELYDVPDVSHESASIYEHCLRALRRACTRGAHGLPLIGIGDWNDGMSRVGVEGKGESVWLAWFLIATLRAFAHHADSREDRAAAAELREYADGYAEAVETHGWDGAWYRRAYFDDGTPLGSSENAECRIDSIAQSWSVISGAGSPERRAQAMRSLERWLVRKDVGILLLTPPFDRTPHDPGYIKGYLPGVRENGAQYTHAALWAVLATAMQGDGDRAFELFQLINPLERTRTPEGVATYRTEPYVVAADVYSAKGHVGRGGWTWYTGSASWMYRVALETILGFTREGDRFRLDPRVPSDWPEFELEYRFGGATYQVTVAEPHRARAGSQVVELDGKVLDSEWVPLADDGRTHEVTVRPLAPAPTPA